MRHLIASIALMISITLQAKTRDSFLWNCEYHGDQKMQTLSGQEINPLDLQIFVYRTFDEELNLESSNMSFLYYTPQRRLITPKWDQPVIEPVDLFSHEDRNEEVYPEGLWPSTKIEVSWENVQDFENLALSLERKGVFTCQNNLGQTKRRAAEGNFVINGKVFPVICVQSGTFRENLVPSQCKD